MVVVGSLLILFLQSWMFIGVQSDGKPCTVEFKDMDEKQRIFRLASDCYKANPLTTREEGEIGSDGKILNQEKQFFIDNEKNCAQKCIAVGLQQTFPNGTLDISKLDEAYDKLNATSRYREKAMNITKNCKTDADAIDIRPNNEETLCKYHMQMSTCLGEKFRQFQHELDALSCLQETPAES